MSTQTLSVGIKEVEFVNGSIMFVHLDNNRTFIVPLDKFQSIKALSPKEKKTLKSLTTDTYPFSQ